MESTEAAPSSVAQADGNASAPALFRVIARVVCAYPDEPTLWTAPQQQPAQQQSAGQDADGALSAAELAAPESLLLFLADADASGFLSDAEISAFLAAYASSPNQVNLNL